MSPSPKKKLLPIEEYWWRFNKKYGLEVQGPASHQQFLMLECDGQRIFMECNRKHKNIT
jgi:hypothetical protein